MSMRSAIEVVAALYLCLKRNYISEDQHKKYYSEYEVLVKMITKLRDSLQP